MKIIKANKDYVKEIASLESKRFADPWNEEQWMYELNENEFSHTLVSLDDNNTLIGYICYWILFDQATINKICVDEKYAHMGIGNALLNQALDEIDNEYCVSTSLEVRVSNYKAINLYQKNKFKTALTKPHYYSDGEDCYYMLRSIGDKYE